MKEIWKDIEGFDGFYKISNFGRIKNINEKILKVRKTFDGYNKIKFKDGKTYSIHRLVAKAFLNNPDNLPCINHIDENKLNNNVDNLEWCSRSYNINYGNRNRIVASKNSRKIEQYDLEGKFIKIWSSITEASRTLKISGGNIVSCCKGRYKKANKFIFKYSEVENVLL